jgi:hypothetical protein
MLLKVAKCTYSGRSKVCAKLQSDDIHVTVKHTREGQPTETGFFTGYFLPDISSPDTFMLLNKSLPEITLMYICLIAISVNFLVCKYYFRYLTFYPMYIDLPLLDKAVSATGLSNRPPAWTEG